MIYVRLNDASALQCLDAPLSEATKPKWYQRLLIIKLSATEGMSVPQLAKLFNLSDNRFGVIFNIALQPTTLKT